MDYRSSPSVQIDMGTVERNIQTAVDSLRPHGIAHRPHIKVHKSVELALLQQKMGCAGITCATLGEAETMADGGITDILLAYPLIGEEKLGRYGLLLRRGITLRTIINSLPGAQGLSALGQALGIKVPVLIELDGGINRGGLKGGSEIVDFAARVKDLPGLFIEGIEYYGGDIYGCKTGEEIRLRARKERDDIVQNADALRKMGLCMDILSGGSSFSLRYPEELEGLTEVRAGNYIFNDNALLTIGMLEEQDCALRIEATIVGRPDAQTAIIDAGSKTLTSDLVSERPGYGYITENPAAIIYKVNEEHGFVSLPEGTCWEIGGRVTIIPNHACTIPNLCDEIYAVRNGKYEHAVRIDARGKNR